VNADPVLIVSRCVVVLPPTFRENLMRPSSESNIGVMNTFKTLFWLKLWVSVPINIFLCHSFLEITDSVPYRIMNLPQNLYRPAFVIDNLLQAVLHT
jgi:hypothetical protein